MAPLQVGRPACNPSPDPRLKPRAAAIC